MQNNHWLLPIDPTPEERGIALAGIQRIYDRFNDPMDQLIIALVFELGYPKTIVADITRRTPKTIWLRIKKIKTILSTTHKSYLKSDLNS
jgi:hypothetical protein